MQVASNLIQINITEVEDLVPPKPQMCFLFDGFDSSEAEDFKITEKRTFEDTSTDAELNDLQKAALERAFQQGGLPLVEIDKLSVVIVKDSISTENLKKALKNYWMIVDYTTTDFSTKFANMDEEKRIFSLVKDLSTASVIDTEYPNTPEARMIEVWWNGDLHAHAALATCYLYRHPEVGAAREVYLIPTDDQLLTGSEKVTVLTKGINDVIGYPIKITGGIDKTIYFFSMPTLKDGSDLVKDYNRYVTVAALQLAMVNVFRKNEVPYDDESIALLTIALDDTFRDLMIQGNISQKSGAPVATFKIPQISKLSDQLQKARTFIVKGSYEVPGGTKSIVLNYEIHQK